MHEGEAMHCADPWRLSEACGVHDRHKAMAPTPAGCPCLLSAVATYWDLGSGTLHLRIQGLVSGKQHAIKGLHRTWLINCESSSFLHVIGLMG